jgi:imidazolonepropionase-like amidohydrolase
MDVKAIVGATVLDGTGRPPVRDAVVLVEGDRIGSVTAASQTTIPEYAEVIEAAGRYVIPGMMDANVPLFVGILDVLLEYEGRYNEIIEEQAQVALAAGITTVFNTWGPLAAMKDVRDRIDRGEIAGSRIFLGGNIVGFGGPLSPDFYPAGNLLGPDTVDRINRQWEQGTGAELLWLTPEEVRRRVRDYVERSGIDFVKYAACAHMGPLITFSAEAQQAIVEEGHRAGLTVQAHTISPESLRMEIDAGADLLQHGDVTGLEPMPEATLKTIADRGLPVAALCCTDRHLAWTQEHGHEWMRTYAHNKVKDDNDRRLIAAGARLLLTTEGYAAGPRLLRHPRFGPLVRGSVDSPNHLGESHVLWMQAAVERGMAPMEALLCATRYVAEAYGQGADLGSLVPGKRADLVILEADPLADVANYRRVAAVMKEGELVDREALPLRRVLTAPDTAAASASAAGSGSATASGRERG